MGKSGRGKHQRAGEGKVTQALESWVRVGEHHGLVATSYDLLL